TAPAGSPPGCGGSDKAAQRQRPEQEGQLAQLLQRTQAVAGNPADPLAQPAGEPQAQGNQRQHRQPQQGRQFEPQERRQGQRGGDQQAEQRDAHRQRLGLAFRAGVGLGEHHGRRVQAADGVGEDQQRNHQRGGQRDQQQELAGQRREQSS